MNAMTTIESRRDEQPREPEGFAEVSRTELETTEGGTLWGATIYTDYLVFSWSGYIRL
jgi:hypothetical protein